MAKWFKAEISIMVDDSTDEAHAEYLLERAIKTEIGRADREIYKAVVGDAEEERD